MNKSLKEMEGKSIESELKLTKQRETMKKDEVIDIRLGRTLNFIDKLIFVDGTIIQNMQYELNAEQPNPNQLIKRLKQPDPTTQLDYDKSKKVEINAIESKRDATKSLIDLIEDEEDIDRIYRLTNYIYIRK